MAAAAATTSMALGVAMDAPPAMAMQVRARLEPQGSKSRVCGKQVARIRRFRVGALPDEEAQIRSIRDDHENLFQRLLDWGRHQILKLFSGTRRMNCSAELADGSLLISFGEVTSGSHSVPARPPSRFSKQLPYAKTAKHTDPLISDSNEGNLEQQKRPSRAPSAFSKKSPIARTSQRHQHWQKKDPAFSTEGQSIDVITSFQGIQERVKENKISRFRRPEGSFTRKSPVPPAIKHRDRRRRGQKQEPKEEQQKHEDVGKKARSESETGSTNQVNGETSKEQLSGVQQPVSVLKSHSGQFHEAENQAEQPKQRSRLRGAFVRKSPITAETLLRSSRRRRKMKAATGPEVDQAVVVRKVAVVKEVVTEVDAKPAATTRIEATVEEGAAKSTGRRQKILMESEFECSDIEEIDGSIDHNVDLSSLTIARLRGIAKSKGLRGYSRLKKAELVALLLAQQ